MKPQCYKSTDSIYQISKYQVLKAKLCGLVPRIPFLYIVSQWLLVFLKCESIESDRSITNQPNVMAILLSLRKANDVGKYAHSTGLKINAAKTKVMRLNANTNQPITSTENKEIGDVKSFIYLGAILTNTGGTNEDIRRKIDLARITYNIFAPVWNNSQISKRTKFRLFKSNVLYVLLYGSETWKMTNNDETMVDTFLHKSLRRILKMYWSQKVTNEEVRKRAGVEQISTTIKKRRWK